MGRDRPTGARALRNSELATNASCVARSGPAIIGLVGKPPLVGRDQPLRRLSRAVDEALQRATGLGGRDRHVNDDRERLRKTVTARIRDTLRRLDDRHPGLAAHLRASVHTGTVCVYAPAEPVVWDVRP